MGLGGQIGSLETGKEADLDDPQHRSLATDPEQVMNIKVSETWVAGKKRRADCLIRTQESGKHAGAYQ